jgi:Ca-activated chloride channel family protein
MGEDGTAIGAGLASASNQLKDLDAKSRVVVLLTDGMNNSGKVSPTAAAEAAAALGIKAYTIGAGTRGEAPMPVKDGFGNVEIRMVKTDIDEKALEEIATKTGGRYFRATDTESLEKTYAEIDALEKTTRVLKEYSNYRELFAFVALAGLMFLGTELALAHTLFRRLP